MSSSPLLANDPRVVWLEPDRSVGPRVTSPKSPIALPQYSAVNDVQPAKPVRFTSTAQKFGSPVGANDSVLVGVFSAAPEQLALGVAQNLYVTLPRGWYAKLKPQLTIDPLLQAPVKQGQKLGMLALKLEEQVLGEYPLVALQEIGAGGLFQRTVDGIRLWFH